MEDQTGKKPFIIPKTYASTKDFLITEKTDCRNVIELFNDIKSCASDANFDFRQNQCKSCDTIRNQKLQKLYNEKRIQMKKDQDPIERFAFHLITTREIASNIANDGLYCEQLTFSIEKYLGNPKDGIHLSKRPDVVLASSGSQGLLKFGLLICKILLGKGFATKPSIENKQFPAQLHHDHHFCKIQTLNKEQRQIDDLLANSLIFCYEHKDLKINSCPSQILPLAILWYEVNEKFSFDSSQESQQRNLKTNLYKPKRLIKPNESINIGSWDDLIQDKNLSSTTKKFSSSQSMSPYTSFSNYRDPRVIRTANSTETILLSPQNAQLERSQSDVSLTIKSNHNEKQNSIVDIPLNSTNQLEDPRLKNFKQTRTIFYLDKNFLKQQEKRRKNSSNYFLIPFLTCSVSSDNQQIKNPFYTDCSSLYVSVLDCFHFGFQKSTNQSFIDLEQEENRLAYQQINISDRLIQREKELKSQEIRLYLREKRQRKLQENFNQQRKAELVHLKTYFNNGRKLLKQHQILNQSVSFNQISSELLNFFSYEYEHENRPYVKRSLAELIGVFIEKYGCQASTVENHTVHSVIDMELASPSSQDLGDHDERFRIPTPPVRTEELTFNQTLNEIKYQSIDLNNNSTETDLILSSEQKSSINNVEQHESLSNENNSPEDENSLIINEEIKDDNENISTNINDESNRSRDEFVKLLTKEAFTPKSPSPTKTRRLSFDNDELNLNKNSSSSRTVTLVSNNNENNLIVETKTNVEQQNQDDKPTVKRIKIDSVSSPKNDRNSPIKTNDDHDYRHDLDERKRSRSRSKSTSSQTSSIKESNTRSPASSSIRHLHRIQQRENGYERNRSSERSFHYQQRHQNNSMSPPTTPKRHQRFNYNHQPVANHPRFAHINGLSPSVKDFNYESYHSSNYSQDHHSFNRNRNSSYRNEFSSNNNNNSSLPPPLMSTVPSMNFSNSYDTKSSHAIECLQMFLRNRKNSNSTLSSSSYQMNRSANMNNNDWSSSRKTENK